MIVYKRTEELWQAIDYDVKEAGRHNDLMEALVAGFICPMILLPISLIADTILLPYDLIKWLITRGQDDEKNNPYTKPNPKAGIQAG